MTTLPSTALAVDNDARPEPTQIPPLAPIRRGRKSRASQARTAAGRYRNAPAARLPGNGLATTPSLQNVPTTAAVVSDPMDAQGHLVVSVNKRVDLLEWEYSHGFLEEAAYRAGRKIQAVFERATAMGSAWGTGDKVDISGTQANQVALRYERAEAIEAMRRSIEKKIGELGFKRLRAHLTEGLTFEAAAAAEGKGTGRDAKKFVAKRFRNYLDDMAQAWAGVGKKA